MAGERRDHQQGLVVGSRGSRVGQLLGACLHCGDSLFLDLAAGQQGVDAASQRGGQGWTLVERSGDGVDEELLTHLLA